ncbi:probable receptor-like protein kinase At5g20050 [Cucurbita pepo subsp. pepo]|uniref:probable receptor-like protein kinase At5g20050 n=1 Tax=Cucurbita pepo subsp. pepo TaxID=3664 RepID=UPI000C9DA52A|nr:probable receptor-like protein kinase At5g20050 [Cucurbita pepo subsp. pepo]
MEDKKAHVIALSFIVFLILLVILARVLLKLSKPFYLICGIDVSLTAAILVYLVIRRRFNRRRKQLESQLVTEGRELRIEYSFLRKVAGVPTKFKYKELEEATDYFRALIGQGSSGSVFKGVLKDGTAVAVKRIEGENRGEKEFRAEVSAIASAQHVNLVRLIGYCINSSGPRFLVYEFVSNGSLDCWIFPKKPRHKNRNRPGGCLAWDMRYRVAIDVAKALAYLHHDCRSRILHLDVKPENILVDENYRAIVSDFGLSKLMGKDESRIMISMRGTKGYLAPEWLLENGISEKSDIYSYGMVLLELVGGQRNVSVVENGEDRSKRKWQYFPRIVSAKLKEGKLMEAVDKRLLEMGTIDEREVRKLVCVGLWCIQEKAKLRPTMATVVDMLEGRVPVEEPPDTQMLVVDLLSVDEEMMNSHERPKLVAFGERMNDTDRPSSSSTTNSYAFSVLSPR